MTSKPKYALIWTSDITYMPGTNAILNALEYYGFDKNIEIHVRFFEDYKVLGEDYLKQWPDVRWSNIEFSWHPNEPRAAYFYLTADDFHFALENLKDYDCVCFWGADVCVLNRWDYYFDVATKMNRIVMATNEHMEEASHWNQMTPKDKWPYIHTWSVPFADVPVFVPKDKLYVLKSTIDLMVKGREPLPSGLSATFHSALERMDALNYAMRDAGEEPIPLPGVLWIFNAMSWGPVMDHGRYVLFCNSKMNSFHRKYWNVSYIKAYNEERGAMALRNAGVFNRKWNFFNRECRVKWTEGLEVYGG